MKTIDFNKISRVLRTNWKHPQIYTGDDKQVPNEGLYDFKIKLGGNQVIFQIENKYVFPEKNKKSVPRYGFSLIVKNKDQDICFIRFEDNSTLYLDEKQNKIVLEQKNKGKMICLELYSDGKFYVFTDLEEKNYHTPISTD